MPYPFMPMPTFAEFRRTLETKAQCQSRALPKVGLRDEQGNRYPIKYLERQVDGKRVQCVVAVEDDDVLAPTMMRNICRRLGIDPKDLDIGMTLG